MYTSRIGRTTLEPQMNKKYTLTFPLMALLALVTAPARADEWSDTEALFKNAGQSSKFFSTAYGYAVVPTIGKGGIGVGGAHGKGRVYAKGKHVGDASMTQITV